LRILKNFYNQITVYLKTHSPIYLKTIILKYILRNELYKSKKERGRKL